MDQTIVSNNTGFRWRWIIALSLAAGVLGFMQGVGHCAEDLPNHYEFSVTPGANIPTDFQAEYLAKGAALGGSLLVPVTPWLSAGLSGSKGFQSTRELSDRFFNDKIRTSIWSITPEIEIGRWFQLGAIPLKPYLTYAGGLYHVTASDEVSSPFGGYSDSAHSSYGGYSFGGGALVQVGHGLAFGPDVRYHTIIINHAPDIKYLTTGLRLAMLF